MPGSAKPLSPAGCSSAETFLYRPLHRRIPTPQMRGRLKPEQIYINAAARTALGNPEYATLTAEGLDLFVIADGPFHFDVAKTGAARLRLQGIPLRLIFAPGTYTLVMGRHQNLKALVFRGGLYTEAFDVLHSVGRRRHVKIRHAD